MDDRMRFGLRCAVALVALLVAAGCVEAPPAAETPVPRDLGTETTAPAEPTAIEPTETETPIPPWVSPFAQPAPPTITVADPTSAPEPTAPPTERPVAPPHPPACTEVEGIVQNGSFDADTTRWDKPYGTLAHTTSEYLSAPGAARLVTSYSSDSLERVGTCGQCIDVIGHLDGWPEVDGRKQVVVEAYLRTDAEIASTSLNAIFLSGSRCTGDHVGHLYPEPLAGSQDWTRVSGTMVVPDTAKSLHIFVWATGADDSGTVTVDDVRACPTQPAAAAG